MLKRLLVSVAMVFLAFSAQAGVITTSDFYLDFAPGIPQTGGLGKMNIRYNHAGVSFDVNIKPFGDSLDNVNYGIDNWVTPVIGSGWDFDPIDLYSIWAEDVIFSTTIGLGIATWRSDGSIYKINFPDGYASWDLTKVDPPAVSSVPEPGSLALLSIGMIGIGAGTIRRKQQKVGTTTRRMSQVGNHLDTMTKNKPPLKQGVYNFYFLLDTSIILFLLFFDVIVKYSCGNSTIFFLFFLDGGVPCSSDSLLVSFWRFSVSRLMLGLSLGQTFPLTGILVLLQKLEALQQSSMILITTLLGTSHFKGMLQVSSRRSMTQVKEWIAGSHQ